MYFNDKYSKSLGHYIKKNRVKLSDILGQKHGQMSGKCLDIAGLTVLHSNKNPETGLF